MRGDVMGPDGHSERKDETSIQYNGKWIPIAWGLITTHDYNKNQFIVTAVTTLNKWQKWWGEEGMGGGGGGGGVPGVLGRGWTFDELIPGLYPDTKNVCNVVTNRNKAENVSTYDTHRSNKYWTESTDKRS